MYKNVYKTDDCKRAEHMAVRSNVGWYYWTHQLVEVAGKDAAVFLNRMFPNPILTLRTGRDRYTPLLDENGKIKDDVVVMHVEEQVFWVSTLYSQDLVLWFTQHKFPEEDVSFKDVTREWEMYAVQGPNSPQVVNSLVKEDITGQKFFAVADNMIDGIPVKINRGGFTGEKYGYEVYTKKENAEAIENRIRKEVQKLGGREVTDFQVMTLSLPGEAGFYLMRDLIHNSPLDTGMERGFDYSKDFIGKEAVLRYKEEGPGKEMVGFTVADVDVSIHQKCFGGPGEPVMLSGEEIGRVSKFTYSYVKETNIGYALIEKGHVSAGDVVMIHGHEAVICERNFL